MMMMAVMMMIEVMMITVLFCMKKIDLIRAAGSGMGPGDGECSASESISSEMAGPNRVKLSGIVEDSGQNALAKEFFENFEK